MTARHSPLPWRASGPNVFSGSRCVALCDVDSRYPDQEVANAALIAEACSGRAPLGRTPQQRTEDVLLRERLISELVAVRPRSHGDTPMAVAGHTLETLRWRLCVRAVARALNEDEVALIATCETTA